MSKRQFAAAILVIYGLLPIWIALAWSATFGVAGFFLGSPFAIALALPYCAGTLAIAFVGIGVFHAFPGSEERKNWLALLAILLLTLVAGAFAAYEWDRAKDRAQERETAIKNLQEMAVQLVDDAARQASLYVIRSTPSRPALDASGRPVRIEVHVNAGKEYYAIVEIEDGFSDKPRLELSCTTTLAPGDRDSFKHPCAQGK